MRCCVYVQAAPGDDIGCLVYVAGGTLARREKKSLSYVVLLYDLDSLCLCPVMSWCIWGTAPV